jgi:hypothetical protein
MLVFATGRPDLGTIRGHSSEIESESSDEDIMTVELPANSPAQLNEQQQQPNEANIFGFSVGDRVKAMYKITRRRDGEEREIDCRLFPATVVGHRDDGKYEVKWDGECVPVSVVKVQHILRYSRYEDIAYQAYILHRWSQLWARACAFRMFFLFSSVLLIVAVVLIVHTWSTPCGPLAIVRASLKPPISTSAAVAFASSVGVFFSCGVLACCWWNLHRSDCLTCPTVVILLVFPTLFAFIYPDYYFWNTLVPSEPGICLGSVAAGATRLRIGQARPNSSCDYFLAERADLAPGTLGSAVLAKPTRGVFSEIGKIVHVR